MKNRTLLIAGLMVTGLIAITTASSLTAPAPRPEQLSIFNDSALHSNVCEPMAWQENWRKECRLRDQSAAHLRGLRAV